MRDVAPRAHARPSILMLAALLGATPIHARAQTPTFSPPPAAAPVNEDSVLRVRRVRLAAARRKLDHVPAARFTEARQRAVVAQSQGARVFVSADHETSYTLAVRTDSSEVEQHARWDDIIVVRAGTGGVRFGRRAEGRRMLAPGEYRGGTLEGEYSLRLAPGDVVRVPAGIPHAFWRDGTVPLEYLVIKVRRGERPIAPP